MPRPHKTRRIYGNFEADCFKPRGRKMSELEENFLEADELEALRLADLEDQYQNDAAEIMGVSRQTFGNIIKRAHYKIADALINGKAIRLTPATGEKLHCRGCGRSWAETVHSEELDNCPVCESDELELEPNSTSTGRTDKQKGA